MNDLTFNYSFFVIIILPRFWQNCNVQLPNEYFITTKMIRLSTLNTYNIRTQTKYIIGASINKIIIMQLVI